MPLDPTARRRCAALAVFTPVLSEDALLDALWLLHDSMRGDTARDIIHAVDQVAQRHGLDARSCKRLYEAFYRALHQPDEELPLDPWPGMVAARPAAAPAAPMPFQSAQPAPVAVPQPMAPVNWAPAAAAVAAAVSPVGVPAAQAGPDPTEVAAAAHTQVFAALMRGALAEVRQLHADAFDDLRTSAIAALEGTRLGAPVRQAVREAWQAGGEAGWLIDLTPKGLAELVHAFYIALAETLGPVDADQVLTRAVRQAEALPAARSFSPRQLI